MSDQLVARPLPNINTDIHASSVIQTHDPSVQASKDSSCLRPYGHCDRQLLYTVILIRKVNISETKRVLLLMELLKCLLHFV